MHGRYSRAEIEAAFGVLTADAPWIHHEGVLRQQSTPRRLRAMHAKRMRRE